MRIAPDGRIRLLRDLSAGKRWRVAAVSALTLASTAAALSLPLVVAWLIDSIQAGTGLGTPLTLLVALAVVAAATSAGSTVMLAGLAEDLLVAIRTRVMGHALRLPVRDVRRLGVGDLNARITADTMQLRNALDVGLGQLPAALLMVTGTLVIMAWLDWVLLAITLGAFALGAVGIAAVYRRLQSTAMEYQGLLGVISQRFTAALTALPTIKAYRGEDWVSGRLGETARQARSTGVAYAWRQSFVGPCTALAQQVALVGVIVAGAARMQAGALDIAGMAAFLLYLLQVVTPVSVVAMGIGRLKAGLVTRERFAEVLQAPTEAAQARLADGAGAGEPAARTTPGSGPAAAGRALAAITLDDVDFDYDGVPVLHGASLSVAPHAITAIVGPSGAGKTTVLKLIEGFEQPASGRITVAGREAGAWELSELRRDLAYVDQECTMLDDTVRANLLLGRTGRLTDAALMQALDQVGMRETVTALPDGLDTVLGSGLELSGGQRQRLALARAILSDARIVLLDEPTSQLDSLSEARFRSVIRGLAQERTVLVVAHRLSTVRHASHVVVLEAGRVAGAGRHDELLDTCPLYRELVEGQLIDFDTSPARGGPRGLDPAGVGVARGA